MHRETNPRFHRLLTQFKQRTGCPVLVNTSFNVRGEPIVCTPEDAFRCFMGTEIEYLAIGNCLLAKEAQDRTVRDKDHAAFELDCSPAEQPGSRCGNNTTCLRTFWCS